MSSLTLITAGAYVEQELSAEFGQIPPAFLPAGLARLYEAQVAALGGGELHLTIPEGFVPPEFDRQRLEALGMKLVPVPAGLRLGESIIYAINAIGATGGMRLLHGDTLIEDIPEGEDVMAVQPEGDDYSWAAVNVAGGMVTGLEVISAGTGAEDGRPVACGYFAFSSAAALVRAITRARGDFIAGLSQYAAEHELRAAPVKLWRDFGHLQTYFRSRRAISTARAFNRLRIDERVARKSSPDGGKIAAEAAWFNALPPPLRPYAAPLVEAGTMEGEAFYSTEYQYAPSLAELFVFGAAGRPTWRRILGSCRDFLEAAAALRGPGRAGTALAELAVGKTAARLGQFASATGFDIDAPNRLAGAPLPSLRRIAEEVAGAVSVDGLQAETVMHGDFCFSNILYDSRAGRIRVIDPRGYVRPGAPSLFGDTRYDLAKLAHSVSGGYDHIMAGRYALRRGGAHDFTLEFDAGAQVWLAQALAELDVGCHRAGDTEVRALVILLFLSMLPLHGDRPDRQEAFIANALRLYREFAA